MSEDVPTPARALQVAGRLLDEGPGPGRARTVVRLLRYALETALDEYWDALRPAEVPATVGRGKRLRLLAATLDRTFAHDTYTAWCRLSDAARPQPYEPAPSVRELRALQRATVMAVDGLEAAAVTTAPATGASSTSRSGTAPSA